MIIVMIIMIIVIITIIYYSYGGEVLHLAVITLGGSRLPVCFSYQVESYTEAPCIVRRSRRRKRNTHEKETISKRLCGGEVLHFAFRDVSCCHLQ